MNVSATIAKMRAAGMSSEAILLALECIVQADPQPVSDVTPKRSAGAERTARWRAKRHGDVTSVTSDVTSVTSDGQKERVSHTLPKEKINTTSRARAKSDLDDDWQPDAKTWALADELGFTAQEAWDQIERMRDWAKNADGGKGRKSDWSAAFRNWLKRAADDRKTKAQAPRRNNIHDTISILDAVTDETIRRASGHRPQGRQEDFDVIPGLRKGAA